jgi:phage-related protein
VDGLSAGRSSHTPRRASADLWLRDSSGTTRSAPSRGEANAGEFTGLIEVVDDFDGDTYRAIYTVKLAGVVYVLHVFQKKSTRGIATPKPALALIRERWQRAKAHYVTQLEGK